MDWYHNLYIGETLKKKKDKIIQKLEKKKRLSDVCIILIPPGEQNQLEIIKSDQLYRYLRQEKKIRIVGLASDRGEAGELIRQMAEDVVQDCGTGQIREYFEKSFEKSFDKL